MEELLKESAKQVPNLAVLGFIVWIFVKHLDKRGQLFSDTTREMHGDHMAAREEMSKALSDNADALRQMASAIKHGQLGNDE